MKLKLYIFPEAYLQRNF